MKFLTPKLLKQGCRYLKHFLSFIAVFSQLELNGDLVYKFRTFAGITDFPCNLKTFHEGGSIFRLNDGHLLNLFHMVEA